MVTTTDSRTFPSRPKGTPRLSAGTAHPPAPGLGNGESALYLDELPVLDVLHKQSKSRGVLHFTRGPFTPDNASQAHPHCQVDQDAEGRLQCGERTSGSLPGLVSLHPRGLSCSTLPGNRAAQEGPGGTGATCGSIWSAPSQAHQAAQVTGQVPGGQKPQQLGGREGASRVPGRTGLAFKEGEGRSKPF